MESSGTHTVYLSVGSNLGNRKKNIRDAYRKVCEFCEVTAVSKAYRTKPYGVTDQPNFINLVARIETPLDPKPLLNRLLTVEEELGRVRMDRWRERTIDLDILFYDKLVLFTPDLIIPHPDMHNRYFVLKPFLDIDPDFVHPVLRMPVSEIYDDLVTGKDR